MTILVNIGSDHIRGSTNNNAPITLVEYGDYECPYTGMAYPIVKELIREFGNDKIRFVFRNFPLNNIHPHAQHASEGSRGCLQLKINSGRCMIIYLNIRKH